MFEFASDYPLIYRILIIVAVAGGSHLLVMVIKKASQFVLIGRTDTASPRTSSLFSKSYPRLATIITILESTFTFVIYFLALGLILQEFNLSLRAYLASTTVIGLAIGFGSHGSFVETNFRQMVLARLRTIYPDYADWMINITYRSERFVMKEGELIDAGDTEELKPETRNSPG